LKIRRRKQSHSKNQDNSRMISRPLMRKHKYKKQKDKGGGKAKKKGEKGRTITIVLGRTKNLSVALFSFGDMLATATL